jgi:DHA1 family tetracycline resistance protein-like MFS transporter
LPRKPAVIFILITLLLDVLGFGLIIPVAPRLVEKLQAAHGVTGGEAAAAPVVGWLTATYAIMQFLFAPMLGALSDRFGRRPVLLFSLLGSGLDYFAMAFVPSVHWLFLTRAVNGLTGASMTTAVAYIADSTTPDKRAGAYGMIGAAFGIGFILGPLVGGLLGTPELRVPGTELVWKGDIHYPFYAAGAVTLLNWLYGLIVLPESLSREHRSTRLDVARANPLGSMHGLSRYPFVARMAVALFLVNLAQFALHSTWVLYTKHRYKWSEHEVGLSLFTVGLCAAVVQGGLARKIIPKLGERRSVLIGLALAACAFVGYALATRGWMIYVVMVATSLGGISMPACQALITHSVRPDEQGRVQGALASLQSLANIAGPVMGAYVFAESIRPESVVPIPGMVYFMSAVLTLGAISAAKIALSRSSVAIHESA